VLFTKYRLASISRQNIVFAASVVGNELVFAVEKVVVKKRICWVGRSEDGCREGKWWDVLMMRSYFVIVSREGNRECFVVVVVEKESHKADFISYSAPDLAVVILLWAK
jgi:hypothetical protein